MTRAEMIVALGVAMLMAVAFQAGNQRGTLAPRGAWAQERAASANYSAAQAQWALVYWQRREVLAVEAVCGCGGGNL